MENNQLRRRQDRLAPILYHVGLKDGGLQETQDPEDWSQFLDHRFAIQSCQTELQHTQKELRQTHMELRQTKTELRQSNAELQQTQTELNEAKMELQQTHAELEHIQNVLSFYSFLIAMQIITSNLQ